jgi:hypothetical protein
VFVAKFSPSGNPLWAKVFGGSEGEVGLGIDTDALGNSYITGYYTGTAAFEDQVFTSEGGWDVFLLKLNPEGNMDWVISEGGAMNDIGYGVATMPDGRSFVTGWFADTIHFHDADSLASYGGSDVLTFACSSNGDLLWKRHGGTVGVEYGYKVAADYFGNCYVTGQAGGGSNFDGQILQGGGALLVSYSPDGAVRWLNCGYGAGVNSIAVDRTPSAIEQFGCISGRLTGTAIFGNDVLTSIDDSDDAYIAVFQLLTGGWVNAASGGGPGSDKGRACTYAGHPFFVGSFEETASLFGFDAVSAGTSDAFVVGSDGTGNNWLLTAGGPNHDVPVDVGVDAEGNTYVCGWYSGTARFGSSIVISSGSDADLDMFVAKINPATATVDDMIPVQDTWLNYYPNPFTSKLTLIAKHTENRTFASAVIHVYNLKGEKVQSLTPSSTDSFSNSYEWNGTDRLGRKAPAGIYFISGPGFSGKARKIILLD